MTGRYRADIDGLRALAVVPVVLFHAGVPGFSGGFVGVDVFFVISGFLLTGILMRELEAGEFSIAAFYVRRARRILPALLVVMAATLLAGFFLMPPEQYTQTGRVAQHVVTITANNHFASIRADYWAESTLAEQPLLHTWSLTVEEQFYVLLPVLLWCLHKAFGGSRPQPATPGRSRLPILWTLLALAACSLLASEWLLQRRPGMAFYLLLPRAWELLAGSCLAVVLHRTGDRTERWVREASGWAGAALVLVPIFTYGERTPFPGIAALLPCLGAVLVILSGSLGGGQVSRLLASRVPVWLGLISYSLYLWHWPVLVYFRSLGWHAQGLPELPLVVQVTVTVALAWFSWRFIEQPFRRRWGGARRWKVLAAAAAALACSWSAGALAKAIGEERWPMEQPIPPLLKRLALDMRATPGLRCEGSGDPAVVRRSGGGCQVGAAFGEPAVVLVGDSHARMYAEAWHVLGQERNERLLVMARSSCVPALGVQPPTRAECRELTQAGIDYLEAARVRSVVLAGYWSDLATSQKAAEELERGLDLAVGRLVGSGKKVVLMLDVPELPDDSFGHRAAVRSIRQQGAPQYGPSLKAHREHQRTVSQMVERVARRHGASLVDPAQALCSASGCLVARDGRSLYRDKHHLTDAAAIELRRLFVPTLESAGAQVSSQK